MNKIAKKNQPKSRPVNGKFKNFLKQNSKIVLGLIIGVLVMTAGLAVAASVSSSNKNKKTTDQQATSTDSNKKTDENNKQQNSDSNQVSSGTGSNGNSSPSSSNNSPNAAPAPPTPPATPSSISYTFFAGTYTPQPFPNYPNGGYTGAGNMSGTLNAQGYVNLRLSWNKTADLQLRVQGSSNGSSWSDFYTYNTSSGSVTVPVNAAYYRVFAYIGNCLGGSPCEGAEFNTPYSLNFSGLLNK